MKRLYLLSGLLLHTAHAGAGELIDETRAVEAGAIIDVEVMNGAVTLTGWDRNSFHIAGELSDAAEGYDLREVAGGIRFEEDLDRRRFNNCWARGNRCAGGDWADLTIEVPRTSVLRFAGTNIEVTVDGLYGSTDIELLNGDVYATDLRGTIKIETVNGDIDANQLDGRITLETVNGNVNVNGATGSRVSLDTTNGNIDATMNSPRILAETVNGDIELEAGGVDELEVTTVGGSLEAHAVLNETGEINVNSVSGRIELYLPANTSAHFNVSTAVNGRITNELSDDEPERRNRYVNSRELDFTLNGGAGDVSVSTVSGSVRLRSE